MVWKPLGAVQVLYNAFGWVGGGGDLLLFVTRVGGYFSGLLYNKLNLEDG